MPILYVNPSGGRKRRVKKPRIGKLRKSRKRMPAALARYWKKRRAKSRKAPATKKKRKASKKRSRSRSNQMPKKKKKKSSRRRGRKRTKASYARAARLGARRRKARKGGAKTKSRRKGRKGRKATKRTKSRRRGRKRSRKSYARAAKLGRRRRARKMQGPVYRKSLAGRGGTKIGRGTMIMPRQNPSRRRKRRKPTRKRGRRTAARLGWRRKKRKNSRRRRYKRFGRYRGRTVYVKNPGRMLIDLAKKAVPIVLATIGAKAITSKIGPRIPLLDKLGAFHGPVVSILAIIGANFATKKVAFLAKRRDAILMGFALNAIHETIGALAPASIKGMLGMGDTYTQALADYVATNDYEQVVGMSDYIATGDMEQDLGYTQEMGLEQEMGMGSVDGTYGQGGLGGARQIVAPVPNQRFLAPVPGHSFTSTVPEITTGYDNPDMLYQGIFRGSN